VIVKQETGLLSRKICEKPPFPSFRVLPGLPARLPLPEKGRTGPWALKPGLRNAKVPGFKAAGTPGLRNAMVPVFKASGTPFCPDARTPGRPDARTPEPSDACQPVRT
jgi:hypothetical protein